MVVQDILRRLAYLLKTHQIVPPDIDIGETAWQAANLLDQYQEENIETHRSSMVALQAKTIRLADLAERMINYAESWAQIPTEYGGPNSDMLVQNPTDPDHQTLPEILEARLIAQDIGIAPQAEGLGMDELPIEMFKEEEIVAQPEDDGSVEAALTLAYYALERKNARSIAGIYTGIDHVYASAQEVLFSRLSAYFNKIEKPAVGIVDEFDEPVEDLSELAQKENSQKDN